MGTFTNFIKLHKPAENEKYNVNIFNTNAELIDSALAHMEQDNENRDNLLDTLNTKATDLTAALISAWNTVTNKVDKVAGKGLSTNDYTTEEKDKLNGIEPGANANVQADWNVSDTTSDAYIKNKPDFTSCTPSVMTGATANAAGAAGSVPAPATGKHNAYLRGDGTWQETSTSLAANVSGIPLDQTAGKMLKDQIDEMNTGLSALEGQFSNFIKTERIYVTATKIETATINLQTTPMLILSVYSDGASPITIDRISSPTGNSVSLHFAETMSNDVRFRIIYI